jgi:hypothetical protein
MSDLVAVPRADLERLLRLVEAHVPGSALAGPVEGSLVAVRSASGGPAVLAPPRHPPYGFDLVDGKLVRRVHEQRVIDRIRALRGAQGAGMSFRQIAEVLNNEGVRAPSGGLWRSETVRRVINREARA